MIDDDDSSRVQVYRMPQHGSISGLPDGPGVYFVRMFTEDMMLTGPIKVGVSDNMRKRVAGLDGMLPWRLSVIGWASGTRDDEQRIHERLWRHRLNGEWFRADDEVIRILAECSEHGVQMAIRRSYEAQKAMASIRQVPPFIQALAVDATWRLDCT